MYLSLPYQNLRKSKGQDSRYAYKIVILKCSLYCMYRYKLAALKYVNFLVIIKYYILLYKLI